MADEILRSKHAFGESANVDQAIADKKVDAYDILFLDEKTNPKIGWINKNGEKVIVESKSQVMVVDALPSKGEEDVLYIYNTSFYYWDGSKYVTAKTEGSVTETVVEEKITTAVTEANTYTDEKIVESVTEANAYTDEKISTSVSEANSYTDEKIEEALGTLDGYIEGKFEITDAPEGTLINYYDNEIRIMCPKDAVFTKQSVGEGGDPNSYYVTLKTYFTDDEIMGYREHLGNQVDAEILKDIKTDVNGRRYQPSWLAVAKYDEATDTWSYYGASSDNTRYIGWDYRIDKYDANDVMIASDFVRINLSNEDCHFNVVPSYVGNIVNEANSYTDTKIAEVAAAYEIVEF